MATTCSYGVTSIFLPSEFMPGLMFIFTRPLRDRRLPLRGLAVHGHVDM